MQQGRNFSREGRQPFSLQAEPVVSDAHAAMDIATARPGQATASGWPLSNSQHDADETVAASFDDAFRHDDASSGIPSPLERRSGSISSTLSQLAGDEWIRRGSGASSQPHYSETSVSQQAFSPEGLPLVSSPESGIPMAASLSQGMTPSSDSSSLFGTSIDSQSSAAFSAEGSDSEVKPSLTSSSPAAAAASKKGKATKPRAPRKSKSGSHAKAKSQAHIPRPRNAFILFRSHAVKSGIVTSQDETDHRNISRIVSHMWNSLSEADRNTWQAEAQKEKEEHARLYPDYKFQPQSRTASKLRRNVSRPEGVVDKCAQIANEILKKNGEDGVKFDENGQTLSASAKFKRDRREAHAMKVANRKARTLLRPSRSRTTSKNSHLGADGTGTPYLAASSPFSGASYYSSSSASPAPPSFYQAPPVFLESRRTSAAGDLATSISTRDSAGGRVAPLALDARPTTLNRRGSSVPPLDDLNHGQYPHKPSQEHILSGEQDIRAYAAQTAGWPRQERSMFRGWDARPSTAEASGLIPGAPGSEPFGSYRIAPMDAVSSARKGPPPAFDLGGHSNLRRGFVGQHLDEGAGGLMSPRSSVGAPLPPPLPESWPTARNAEGAPTPRASAFQHALRLWPERTPQDDITLLSPLKNDFNGVPSGGRRTSAAWSNWNRMSTHLGGPGPSPSGGRRISFMSGNTALASSLPSQLQQEAVAYPLFSPATNAFATQFASNETTRNVLPAPPPAPFGAVAADTGMAVDENVFQFSPEFLMDLEGGQVEQSQRTGGQPPSAAHPSREIPLTGIEAEREAISQNDAFGRRMSTRLFERWMHQQQVPGPPEEEVAVFDPAIAGNIPVAGPSRLQRRRSSQQQEQQHRGVIHPSPTSSSPTSPSASQPRRSPATPRKKKGKATTPSTEGVVQRSVPLSPAPRRLPQHPQ